jgi:hypothetical protein
VVLLFSTMARSKALVARAVRALVLPEQPQQSLRQLPVLLAVRRLGRRQPAHSSITLERPFLGAVVVAVVVVVLILSASSGSPLVAVAAAAVEALAARLARRERPLATRQTIPEQSGPPGPLQQRALAVLAAVLALRSPVRVARAVQQAQRVQLVR